MSGESANPRNNYGYKYNNTGAERAEKCQQHSIVEPEPEPKLFALAETEPDPEPDLDPG
jgi:hypothetical protein